MFTENVKPQQPPRRCDLFLRSRPYRGEPPTVAGFLLYPDAPAKMESTSREAFCFKPMPQQDGGKGHHLVQKGQRGSQCPSRQSGSGHSSSRDSGREQTAETQDQDKTEMKSQYQKDFPPPSSCRRRRTPAPPQPDNIGINPAFRFEFNTVQREAFPEWPSVENPRCVDRLKAASPRQTNMAKEYVLI